MLALLAWGGWQSSGKGGNSAITTEELMALDRSKQNEVREAKKTTLPKDNSALFLGAFLLIAAVGFWFILKK